jgi:hypothetical protein
MHPRHPQNAPGDWYVNTTCTNCGAAQTVAPGLIVERDGQSVFDHQPETEEELRQVILGPIAAIAGHGRSYASRSPACSHTTSSGSSRATAEATVSLLLKCEPG